MYTENRIEGNKDIEFSHFVVVKNEGSVIGFSNRGPIYKLLTDTATAWIKIYSAGQWIELPEKEAEQVHRRAQESFWSTPAYHVPRFIP